MSKIISFESINAWQVARELTKLIYDLSNQGGFSRDFGLRDQIRRAAVSAMSNIAEGYASGPKGIFIRYLRIAKGSTGEVQSQLYVALDQAYINSEKFDVVMDKARKLAAQLSNFIKYLQSHP